MQIKVLSPLWGHEHLKQNDFLNKIRNAGYDGIDTWVPKTPELKRSLYNYLQKHQLIIVTHQHEAEGKNFAEFKSSFLANLKKCAEPVPVLINSHTGRDYFTLEQNLALLEIATEFSEKTGITVAHETHRGRIGYGPAAMKDYFTQLKDFSVTADFSHWVCVSESMLESFQDVLTEAILRTRHVHARIGFEEGPQVPNPQAPEWSYALNHFLTWWDKIVEVNEQKGHELLTFTTEFGPPPYMPIIPFSKQPVADQFRINCYMKELLENRYSAFRQAF